MVCDVNIQWCCVSSFLWTHTGRIPILWLYCNHSAAKFEFIFWCVKTPNVSWLTSDFFALWNSGVSDKIVFFLSQYCGIPASLHIFEHIYSKLIYLISISWRKKNKTRLWSSCCLVLRRKRFGAVGINIPYYLHGERLSYFEFPNCSSGTTMIFQWYSN